MGRREANTPLLKHSRADEKQVAKTAEDQAEAGEKGKFNQMWQGWHPVITQDTEMRSFKHNNRK